MLSEQCGEESFEKEYGGSTENVIKNVLLGKAEAGVVLNSALANVPADDLDKIRTLLNTEDIPAHPLSAHPRVPTSARLAVQKAVLALGATPEGAALLDNVRLPAPVMADYDRDYRALEGINVKRLTNWGN